MRHRRQKTGSGASPTAEHSPSTGAPFVFETLEPRLLLAADLIAGYNFNEASGTSAADASGHNLVGTLTSGPTHPAGQYGNAVGLDGVNDYVNLGNPAALQLTGSMTVSAWINSSSFPGDDAAIVSKRGSNEVGFQLDTTVDKGPRTIGFKLTNSSGGQMFRYGATALQPNTWYYVTGVYNAATQTLDVYLNGQLDNGQLQGTITASQQNSTSNVTVGRRAGMTGFEFAGRIDDVRIYGRALTQAEIQADMVTPLTAGTPTPDTTAPTVALTAPTTNAAVAGTVTVSATASDNVGVVGVQFLLDGATLNNEDTTSPYSISWNTTTASNGLHTLSARARDAAGNLSTSSIAVTVDNQAPTGTIVINNDAAATNSTTVTLALSASDALSGVTQMRFSNNGTSFSTAEAFATTKTWTLTTGAGTKTVYVQFRDGAGNWSSAFTDTIVLDTTAPTITAVTATNITSNSVTITWTTNESATSKVDYGLTTSYGSTTALDSTLVTAHSVVLTGLAPNTTYNYRVRSIDAAGNERLGGNTTFRTAVGPDVTAPSAPTGLTATPISSSQINLSWTASTDNVGVTGYQVFRDGVQIATTTATNYSSTGLVPSTPYAFTVKAFDAANNVSGPSATANATTLAPPDTIAPSVPTGLTATAVSPTQINLSWTASTDNVGVTGYQVFRDGVQIATTTATNYSSIGLAPSTPYAFTVKAVDAANNVSGPSTTANATTQADTVAPSTPTGLTATAVSSSQINLSWTASTDNVAVTGYQVFRNGVQIATTATTSYSSTGLAPSTLYSYAIKAVDGAGNASALSASANATTLSNTQVVGLQASYAFDETSGTSTSDASGHGIAGTLNGATFAAGKNGNAISLDGVSAYVSLGNPVALQQTGSMTISAWINSSSFPVDDAAIVSKRNGSEIGFQLDTTVDKGPRTISFKLTNSSGGQMFRYGATALQPNTWYYVTGVYNATTQTLDVYLNGVLDNGQLQGTVTASQQNSTANVTIGRRSGNTGYEFAGRIDDVRIYSRALTQAEIQADMAAPVGAAGPTAPPAVHLDGPADGAVVSDLVVLEADATDDVGVAGVQFFVDGVATGSEVTTGPYTLTWDTRTASNGAHTITAQARDTGGLTTMSAPITVNVANAGQFVNEILATGFDLPTTMAFLPDGRMLVAELRGTVWVLAAPYTQASPTPFLQLTNVGANSVEQGVYDIAIDPNFATNHYFYVSYTLGSPNRDRVSRFTANATLTGTVPGSEFVLYQDSQPSGSDHHVGAITFGNDGKIYLMTGDEIVPSASQSLSDPRGKVLRINPDGTVPTDNPFYDGAGPNYDAIWALGLRNPYRAYYDAPTGRLLIGDVGGNDWTTAIEELDIGARGANYGWPNVEAPNGDPAYTAPAYYYTHYLNGTPRDAAITAGFVYHGTQFPSSYQGSFFFADYVQNWIRRLTFDANGNVTGVFNFEPLDGSVDGPYGDIVKMVEGPDGALYYVDIGFSDQNVGQSTFGLSKIHRISFAASDLPPVAVANAAPTQGSAPLTVNFSSAGSSDPEGQSLSYLWTFGDGTTSNLANPSHTYATAGLYQARLTVSDGTHSTLAAPLAISAGNRPVITGLTPTDGGLFRAGDVISFSANATDLEDGTLPASAYTWNIDFLHEGHVHPGLPVTGVKSGTFTIPTTGHDFSGFTRYRITLTVTDSDGLQSSAFTTVFPDKVNLTFDTAPGGLAVYIDGIPHTGPFVYDTLIGFNHTIEARDQTLGANTYTFASWSDTGNQQHTIVVPSSAQTYTASYNVVTAAAPLAFVQANAATPQTNQSQVSVAYTGAQVVGDTNIIAIGWSDITSNITSVTDSAGNVYQLAVPTARGANLSQAIYYAKNIKAAAPGTNTVTVTFNAPAPYVDVRITEYSGLDPVNPFDVGATASGNSGTANSGSVTTTAPRELVFGAGMTMGTFSGAGTGFATRIITNPDADIAEDNFVTTTGSYGATASLSGGAEWLMQVAAFRAANQS